nr:recombinase family protein [uncultured Hyphomonas sp.]
MRVAYARVSTEEQSLDLQIDALKRAGFDELFCDHGVSGVALERPGLQEALALLKEGDTLVVWRLDRLARSLRELTDLVWSLHDRNIGFHSLCEYIDVGSAFGEFTLHVLSAVAHFERALIVERTKAGMQAARERGVQFGRPPALSDEEVEEAVFLMSHGLSVEEAALQFGVGRSTLYRYLSSRSERSGSC